MSHDRLGRSSGAIKNTESHSPASQECRKSLKPWPTPCHVPWVVQPSDTSLCPSTLYSRKSPAFTPSSDCLLRTCLVPTVWDVSKHCSELVQGHAAGTKNEWLLCWSCLVLWGQAANTTASRSSSYLPNVTWECRKIQVERQTDMVGTVKIHSFYLSSARTHRWVWSRDQRWCRKIFGADSTGPTWLRGGTFVGPHCWDRHCGTSPCVIPFHFSPKPHGAMACALCAWLSRERPGAPLPLGILFYSLRL